MSSHDIAALVWLVMGFLLLPSADHAGVFGESRMRPRQWSRRRYWA